MTMKFELPTFCGKFDKCDLSAFYLLGPYWESLTFVSIQVWWLCFWKWWKYNNKEKLSSEIFTDDILHNIANRFREFEVSFTYF